MIGNLTLHRVEKTEITTSTINVGGKPVRVKTIKIFFCPDAVSNAVETMDVVLFMK